MPAVDVVAALPHYWRHLSPVVEELEARGVEVRSWATRHGQTWGDRWTARHARGDLCLVASGMDARLVRDRPTVYLEHGAGQTYGNGEHGYAGMRGLDHVRLFLAPGEPTAAIWREVYPWAAVEAVGCPALDRHQSRNPDGNPGVVAFTFHWNCGVAPESRTAFDHYLSGMPDAIARLRADGWRIVGHGHPRIIRRLERFWTAWNVPTAHDWDDVLATTDVLVGDNTSAMYEAAALDVPVVVLNAPWYRRDIDLPPRFWSYVPGEQVDEADGIPAAVARAPHADPGLRRRAAAYVYAPCRPAAARAADAIMEALMAEPRRPIVSESMSHGEQLALRMTMLGATDEEVAEFRRSWEQDEWNPGEREQLIGLGDQQLRESILAVRAENDFHSQTPDEAAAIQAQQMRDQYLSELSGEAYERTTSGTVDDVLAWVGDDLDRAGCVLEWETKAEAPRKTLVGPLLSMLGGPDEESGPDGPESGTEPHSGS